MREIKDALHHYTVDGPMGQLLDAEQDGLSLGALASCRGCARRASVRPFGISSKEVIRTTFLIHPPNPNF